MISELADFYGLSKQAVKMRIREMGYAKIDGAFTYVNGQYVTPFSFDASALSDNQSFTISSSDLFKAYCLNKDFRKAISLMDFLLFFLWQKRRWMISWLRFYFLLLQM